jgi:toxin ParE1/3/4
MQLRWALRARRDLLEMADHYGEIDPDLSDLMLRRAQTAPLFLTEHPFAGPPIDDTSLRKWWIRGTPYLLLYRVTRDAVEVARVVHHATNWRAEP